MNPKTITASIVASQRRQSDAERIAELERRVAALEREMERRMAQPSALVRRAIHAALDDGRPRRVAEIADMAGYSTTYININLITMARRGEILRVAQGVYRRAE